VPSEDKNFESFVDEVERYFPEELKPRLIEPAIPTPSILKATHYPYPQYFEIEEESQIDIFSWWTRSCSA